MPSGLGPGAQRKHLTARNKCPRLPLTPACSIRISAVSISPHRHFILLSSPPKKKNANKFPEMPKPTQSSPKNNHLGPPAAVAPVLRVAPGADAAPRVPRREGVGGAHQLHRREVRRRRQRGRGAPDHLSARARTKFKCEYIHM